MIKKKASRFFIDIAKYMVVGIGYYEIAVGILQWMGIMQSHHYGYAFTGTFYNPGPYACFLSIMVPISVSMMDEHYHRAERWVGTGMVLVCAVLIPATLSRTAMIACAIGTGIAMSNSIYSYLKKIGKMRVLVSVIVFLIAIISLYSVKKDSADGRILMWKVAAQTVMDTPLTGVGWDNLAGEYGEAQERYFETGKASEQEVMVADAPEYVFNEYLQVAIAFGPLASVLMIAILSGGIVTALMNNNHGIAGSAVAASIIMFSSYPLQFPLFVITIGIVFIGCYLSSNSIRIWVFGVGITVCCVVLFLANSNKTDVNSKFHIAHSLHQQGSHRKSNFILLELKRHCADPMILNIIGKNYQRLGMTDSSIYYLRKSTFRCPNRMYPHYLLMKLYDDSVCYNKDASIQEAQIIVSMKPKVESDATRDMKMEAARKLKIENFDEEEMKNFASMTDY